MTGPEHSPADPTAPLTGPDDLRIALDDVVGRVGPGALHDPVALEAALRRLGTLGPDDIAVLAAIAGSGVVRGLRSADPTATGPAEEAAVRHVLATTASAAHPDDPGVRRAVAAFVAAAGPSGGRDEPVRLSWGGTAAVVPERFRRRRAPVVAAVVVAAVVVAVLLAGGAALALGLLPRPAGPATAPDRYAIGEVAGRYRALGATLLDGARSCAPARPRPGDTEAVTCVFDRWTMTLTTYDTPGRLIETRNRSVGEAARGVRDASRIEPNAAIVASETGPGTVTSTIYWDTALPRPVSAVITGTGIGLPDLVARYDARGSALVERPEVPGPAFASGALWKFASASQSLLGASCGPIPADDPARSGAVDAVRCTFPTGVRVDFFQLTTYEQLIERRLAATSEDGKVPGTLRNVNAWGFDGTDEDTRGQLAEYVSAADGDAYVYWDRQDTLSFGLLTHPDFTQDQLEPVWRE
jgi:hypothetical protein